MLTNGWCDEMERHSERKAGGPKIEAQPQASEWDAERGNYFHERATATAKAT